jgi:hypothetical protein
MYINKRLGNGIGVTIIVRHTTEERLRTTCFRGTSLNRAGNFSRWDSAEDLFRDGVVLTQVLAELDGAWEDRDFGTHSLCVKHPLFVGWESTDVLTNYQLDDLERFDLNRKSWGLCVKACRTNLLTPRTTELTIVFQLKSEYRKPIVVVHSIYPGSDVGELNGDVTNREKRVFFSWNHPGET